MLGIAVWGRTVTVDIFIVRKATSRGKEFLSAGISVGKDETAGEMVNASYSVSSELTAPAGVNGRAAASAAALALSSLAYLLPQRLTQNFYQNSETCPATSGKSHKS